MPAKRVRVAEVMQGGVLSVSPELPIADFEEFLTTEDIGGVPVLGADGQVLGIASKTDIVRALSDESPLSELARSDLRVEDIMTHEVVVVSPDDDVKEVARRMIDGHIHRVLVCDGPEVVGIVTPFDLLHLLAR